MGDNRRERRKGLFKILFKFMINGLWGKNG